jgi:hypothetical protein
MYGQFGVGAIVVQKYGGTSVGTPERIRDVARRVAAQYWRLLRSFWRARTKNFTSQSKLVAIR